MSIRALPVLAASLILACGPAPEPAPPPTPVQRCIDQPRNFRGTPGTVTAATLISNVFMVPSAVSGVHGPKVLVDSGAPVTLLEPGAYPGATIPSGSGTVDRLDAAGLSFEQAPVIGGEVGLSGPGLTVGGIFGADYLCHFASSFNYRDATVTLGEATPPSGLQAPGTPTSLALEGGGPGMLPNSKEILQILPTRVVVQGLLEGKERTFILDTGASFTVVTPSLFLDLTSDGRKRLGGLSASTVMGNASTEITRVRSIRIGDAEVVNSPVATTAPALLKALATEVHHPVDALIGGTFLREFYVTVDYPNETLVLRRYANRDHVTDEFIRVGVTLRAEPSGTSPRYQVGSIFAGSDAETSGLAVGDGIVSIDGQPLDALSPFEADRLLAGPVGAKKLLQLAGRTLSVGTNDLIPLP